MSEQLNQQVTQTLAEAFNLLAGADLTLAGAALTQAGAVMASFQSIIQALSEGNLVLTEVEQSDAQPQAPTPATVALADSVIEDIIEGEVDETS